MPRLAAESRWGLTAAAVVAALAVATGLVALLETALGIENASAVFLLAVSVIALWFGTIPAVATAVGAFLDYNFLFVEPRYTFIVSRAQELLTLFLLLFVGVVISRLAGLQRAREQDANRREREARALFGISRELVTSERMTDAMRGVAGRLVTEAGMQRIWIGIGPTVATERVVADSDQRGEAIPARGSHFVLQRDRAEGSAAWTKILPPSGSRGASRGGGGHLSLYRVELRSSDGTVGSLWAQRRRSDQPQVEETRLLAAAADQVGAAIHRERLMKQAAELEIARRSDELKSALVDSVSHDLRTPLATIRAAAGSLADEHIEFSPQERRETARAIDTEADRLNHLVGDLLDMSRIQAGALVPELETVPLLELLEPAVERAARAAKRPITLELDPDLPAVRVDTSLLDRVVANLLDNAVKHAGDSAAIRVSAVPGQDGTVALTVEDGGPGVPDEAIPRLFERFSSLASAGRGSRRGVGLGLAIVRGLTEAMGGAVSAGRGSLGGLAVTVTVPADVAAPSPT